MNIAIAMAYGRPKYYYIFCLYCNDSPYMSDSSLLLVPILLLQELWYILQKDKETIAQSNIQKKTLFGY